MQAFKFQYRHHSSLLLDGEANIPYTIWQKTEASVNLSTAAVVYTVQYPGLHINPAVDRWIDLVILHTPYIEVL